MAIDVDIEKSHVLAKEPVLTTEFLPLPSFLHPIEVMTGQLPGTTQFLFDR